MSADRPVCVRRFRGASGWSKLGEVGEATRCDTVGAESAAGRVAVSVAGACADAALLTYPSGPSV